MINPIFRQWRVGRACARGFTLLEIMVALTLGLLLSIGIISLFGTTSNTNRLQDGLARLQENGRYAVTRIEADLRMLGGQYCSNRSGNATPNANAPTWAGRAPMVYAAALNLPDSGGMNSVNAAGAGTTDTATNAYALSPRFFMQGYQCANGGTCAVPAGIPAAGLAVNQRVPNTDVLTIRYQRGSGWPLTIDGNCNSGGSITVSPLTGDDEVEDAFVRPQALALVTDCQNPSIVPIASATGNVLAIGSVLPGGAGPGCTASALRDVRVFNFSDDFVTVTYYLRFTEDDSPDARPNGGGARRLIPTLTRQENGGLPQDVVQGVDLLEFRYAVQDSLGNTRFLNADQIDSRLGGSILCPFKPDGVNPNPTNAIAAEPGCLWRAVRMVEARLLLNTVNEVFNLDPVSRSYRFADSGWLTPGEGDALPSGILARSMLRREFIAQVSNRNYNP